MAPHAFLPLACSANLAKNLAAVAASSTRAPIYRTFALQNNLVRCTQPHDALHTLLVAKSGYYWVWEFLIQRRVLTDRVGHCLDFIVWWLL